MNRRGNQLLAGAGFPLNQHRNIDFSNLPYGVEQFEHPNISAYNPGKALFRFQATAKVVQLGYVFKDNDC